VTSLESVEEQSSLRSHWFPVAMEEAGSKAAVEAICS
jgi:hypothetical protein